MIRLGAIIWICLGALGLGILVLEGIKRKRKIDGYWYVVAPILGPIFLAFLVPLWLGKWGKKIERRQ